MTVVITSDRITSIEPEGKSNGLKDPQVVDGTGKFLIPGLWDMHVHLGSYDDGRKLLPFLLAGGITGVRDMASPPADILRLRDESNRGVIPGPEMVVAGPILQGPMPFRMPLLLSVKDEPEARQAVKDLKKQGVDFIKVGDSVLHDSYFAIADESKRQGLSYAGHLPVSVTALEASAAGQRSIEHFGSARFHGELVACSTREEELGAEVRKLLDAARNGDESAELKVFRAALTKPLLESFSAEKAEALFAAFARNKTWQVPTLAAIQNVWSSQTKELTQEEIEIGKRIQEKYADMILRMRRAGVKLLAGTDLPVTKGDPVLHQELSLLVAAGMTPMEALQTATRNPAEFLGKLDSLGTVEQGKIANLVLLEADPLQDIANTKKISAVILRGKVLPKSLPEGQQSK